MAGGWGGHEHLLGGVDMENGVGERVSVLLSKVVAGASALCPRLAQGPERRPQLLRKQRRLFPGGEVPAPGGLVVVHEGRVTDLDPAALCLEISPGKALKATGRVTGGGVWPAAAWARALSQYERAAETPVPVS